MKLGEFIKDVLDRKKISQVDLAQRINLTPAQVSRIISGERGTSIETLVLIADALGVERDLMLKIASGSLFKNTDVNKEVEEINHKINLLTPQRLSAIEVIYHTGLSALWSWALSEGFADENVVRRIKPPKPEERVIVPYTLEEVKLMLASIERTKRYTRPGQTWQDRATLEPERSKAILLFLLDTGVRAEELCNIKVGQVDKRLMRVKIFGKGAKDRYVSFSARTAQALWRYLATREDLKDDQPLFSSRQSGAPLTRTRLLKMVVAIGNRAGVKGVSLHRFRHTFAISYLRNRGDVYTLQRLLGHSTLDMVKNYLAIVQVDIENAYNLASPVGNWGL